MFWNGFRNPLTVALLLQFAVICGGTLITMAMLKVHGYPDAPHYIWNPVSVFIRSWGWWAILIPPIWLGVLLWRGADLDGLRAAIIASIVVVALIAFYWWTAATAGAFYWTAGR
ncbi:hypothetical protein [Haloferula helveola]